MSDVNIGDQVIIMGGNVAILQDNKGEKAIVTHVETDGSIRIDIPDTPNGKGWWLGPDEYKKVNHKKPFEVGEQLTWAPGLTLSPYYPEGVLTVREVSGPSATGVRSIKVEDKKGKQITGSDYEFVRVDEVINPTEPSSLPPKAHYFMLANTLYPDALLEDKIQLAEWLMK